MKQTLIAIAILTITACASTQAPLQSGFASARTGEVTTTATATTRSTIVTIK